MSDSILKFLHHHKSGHGPNILLAFHGIGQDGLSCFQPFTENLSDYYTIYAFDLFFHGKSIETSAADYSKSEVITKEIWTLTIRHFLHKENISRFDIAGFSMGGRFALATLETFSDQIDYAFLIAPDGVSEHLLYTLASRYFPARRLFRWFMENPQPFFRFADTLQKAGMIHSSLYRFTQQVLDTPEKRLTIYQSWVAFRELHFDIAAIYQKLKSENVSVYLFVGKYDKLLKPDAVKTLARLLPAEHYFVLSSGHSQLVEKVSLLCAKLLS